MQNIARNFGEQVVSEETIKIATKNAIELQKLTILTENAIYERNTELAEALSLEIINAQSTQGV